MRVKMDYNNFASLIASIVNSSKSRLVKERGFGAIAGLNILGSYLKDIANRAIELNDPILLSLCLDLGIINASEEEIKEIERKVKEAQQ